MMMKEYQVARQANLSIQTVVLLALGIDLRFERGELDKTLLDFVVAENQHSKSTERQPPACDLQPTVAEHRSRPCSFETRGILFRNLVRDCILHIGAVVMVEQAK